ncbi:SO2930 family diheme c-type cytochrome [Sandarakinorhabdus limnophila]|uniref:SO2930 family diheme c-type cytochrome n=1 Tax=Sandarakinorhabdus limnophila TaxID=210512 RepID=UPI0026F244C3|nr:SO2930 family diheme c-type cytochrome [Sandarakinorhabdus limnophila]
MRRIGAALLLLGAAPAPGVRSDLLMATDAPKLADYGMFDAAGRPAPGVQSYTLNTPLFSDGAEKYRFAWLPPGTNAEYRPSGALAFPVGTVLVKRFGFPADLRQPMQNVRPIETRLLIRRPAGWVALSYVEQDGGAVLKRAGMKVPVEFIDKAGRAQAIDYAVPNQNQCKTCHQDGEAITPIGPTAGNLNGSLNGRGSNQLMTWSTSGRLTGLPAGAWPRLAKWDDAAEPLDARARAYLAVNCGHCHSRGGFASNSGLYLVPEETIPAHLGVMKRPVAAGRGSGGHEFSILPGQPDKSIMLHRMIASEPGIMMPQFGRALAHEEGNALIRTWIAAMPAPTAPTLATTATP